TKTASQVATILERVPTRDAVDRDRTLRQSETVGVGRSYRRSEHAADAGWLIVDSLTSAGTATAACRPEHRVLPARRAWRRAGLIDPATPVRCSKARRCTRSGRHPRETPPYRQLGRKRPFRR